MKKVILVVIGAAMLIQCQALNNQKTGVNPQKEPKRSGSLTIATAPDLFGHASVWAAEYNKLNPEVKIQVVKQGESKTADVDLTLVTDESISISEAAPWKMVIGRDAIVPVFNSNNPYLGELVSQGVSAEEFGQLIKNPEMRTWANLLKGAQNSSISFYLINSESLKSTIASFTGLTTAEINGTRVNNGAEMAAAIQKDPNAIGFCRLADITDASGEIILDGISLLPIDKNANGKIDYIENIYANVTDLTRGIWIGKYPKPLCRNLYICSLTKPEGDTEISFVKFILTNGQQFIEGAGFKGLSNSERLSKSDRLPATFLPAETAGGLNLTQLIITLIAGLVIVLALLSYIFRYRKNRGLVPVKSKPIHQGSLSEKTLLAPKGLLFDKSHTWAFMDKDGEVKIGIDDFLQHVTGQITSIKMKKPGDKVTKGENILTIIQKGKRLNIKAPLSGIIRAENLILLTDSSLINSSPYADGWVYRIEPTNWSRETQFLQMSEKYAEWLKTEFSRLRDFLAHAIKSDTPEYAYVILQDGGEITDNLLENFGPEVWEEFQTSFIDSVK